MANTKRFAPVLVLGVLAGIAVLALTISRGSTVAGLVLWSLFVLVIVVPPVFFVVRRFRATGSTQTATARLNQRGVLAVAHVVDFKENLSGDTPTAKLNLRIEGPGVASFDAQQWVNSGGTRGPLIASRRLAVRIEPATHAFLIDWEQSGFVSGLTPLTVTVDEDSRAYDLTGKTELVLEYLQALQANDIDVRAQDLRYHPARELVYAIVRRADSPSQPATVLPGSSQPSHTERLQQLDTMRATGVISESEFAAKRQQIIADL